MQPAGAATAVAATTASSSSSSSSSTQPSKENKALYLLLATSLFSIFFLFFSFSSLSSSSPSATSSATHLHRLRLRLRPNSTDYDPPPPTIAYFLYGSSGDADRLLRLLFSVYHPNNRYLLHLDLSAPQSQRLRIARTVFPLPNVDVIGRPDFSNIRGSSALASTLHAAAILLRLHPRWDWFINLSVDDYPLITQDDLLHVLSFLPKDLNFIQHTSHIGWRESRRIRPIIVDPGFYLSSMSDVFYVTQKRELPKAYRLFTGSGSVVLSRKLVEFCILGSDNLPRTLLMYFTNMLSSHANYFHTVVCNSREFNKTTINYNLQYVSWDEIPRKEPKIIGMGEFDKMIKSGAAFGTRFHSNDPVLDHIDREILKRKPGKMVPGGWCLGGSDDPCRVWGDAEVLRPGPGAKRLERAIVELLSNRTLHSDHCIPE